MAATQPLHGTTHDSRAGHGRDGPPPGAGAAVEEPTGGPAVPLDPHLAARMSDRVHHACGRRVLEGWLNVDGFDESYPQRVTRCEYGHSRHAVLKQESRPDQADLNLVVELTK